MTILPKKKIPKDRQEDRASTSRGHGIHAPVSPLPVQGATQYGLLADAAPSPHNAPQENIVNPYHAHVLPGPSQLRPQTVLRVNGPSSPSNPMHLGQLNRNKKLKVFSDEDEIGDDSDGGRGSVVRPSVQGLPVSSNGDLDGCNSDDEFGNNQGLSPEEWLQKESAFGQLLKEKRGFNIRLMKEDGACLFRAVADQVFGDQEMHDMVRQQCMDYMERNEDYFSQYITEDFHRYISRKRTPNTHGNHVEIQSISEMYNRRIEVYQYDIDAINVFQGSHPQENAPIRVSYHQKSHYNSVVDPYAATVGVGLGLPNLQPGLAEQRMVSQAVGQSEQDLIEKQMLEDKLFATDWEATDDAIEQQIAQASYLEWMKENEKLSQRDNNDGQNEPSTSSHHPSDVLNLNTKEGGFPESDKRVGQMNNLPPALFGLVPRGPAPQQSKTVDMVFSASSGFKIAMDNGTKHTFLERNSLKATGLNDWDEEDGDLLAQVLAASQAEYLESLKPRDRDAQDS